MSQIALRLARLGDAPRIANASRTLIEAGLPWSWTPRRVATHMRSRQHLTVIAANGGELAGFVLAQFGSRAVHVALLGAGPAHHRRGRGQQLVRWVEERAGVEGDKDVWSGVEECASGGGLFLSQLTSRPSNQQAQRFYARLGYRETTRS